MARRVFIHIGAPKTGTSYLQTLLRANTEALAAHGVLLPGNRGDHYRFRLAVAERLDVRKRRPDAYTAWDRVLSESQAWPDTVLITNELLGSATAEQAKRTVDAFAPAEVHVIYTARDLARTLAAQWQQSVKSGSTTKLGRFVERLTEPTGTDGPVPDLATENRPTRVFHASHDVGSVLSRWGAGVDNDHVHVVTLPPAGSEPGVLWRRFSSVLGIDPQSCVEPEKRVNESLGAAEAELLRRVNIALGQKTDHGHSLKLWVRNNVALRILARRPAPIRFALGPDEHAWAADTARGLVDEIRGRGYDVVGDLDDLIPDSTPSVAPHADDVDEADVNAAAVDTIAELVVRQYKRRRTGSSRAARSARARRRTAPVRKRAAAARLVRRLRRR